MSMSDRNNIFERATKLYEDAMSRATGQLERDELGSRLERTYDSIVENSKDVLHRSLEDRAPQMLKDWRRTRKKFEKNVLKRWGKAFDALHIVYVIAYEMGEQFNREQRPLAAMDRDMVFEALVGLHTRACLATSEAMALLRSGHPSGAMARWRTIHECAVVASIIGDNGRKEPFSDLAERYLLHDTIQNERDARSYQANHESLGVEPLSDEELTDMKEAVDELVTRFGATYKENYGWARPLFPEFPKRRQVQFRDLEDLAHLDHVRPYYGRANHDIHADSKGARLNRIEFEGTQMLLAGPIASGLTDPGQWTATSLYQVTVSLILLGRPQITDASDVPSLEVLNEFVDSACELFFAAETKPGGNQPQAYDSDPSNDQFAT